MYFHELYPNFKSFKQDLEFYIYDFDHAKNKIFDFNDDTNRYTPLETIYIKLVGCFYGRPLRYQNDHFKVQFWTTFIDHYPNLYIQQLIFANNQLEKLVDKHARGTIQTSTPTGSTIATNYTAETNAGKVNSSSDPYQLKNETIFHKAGSQSENKFKNRVTTNNQQDLYMNALAISNSTINFGLRQFCQNFIHLAKMVFVPNLLESKFEPTPAPQTIEFDSDTVKKIKNKYTVVGIKDE